MAEPAEGRMYLLVVQGTEGRRRVRKHVLRSGPASGLANHALSPKDSTGASEVSEPRETFGVMVPALSLGTGIKMALFPLPN